MNSSRLKKQLLGVFTHNLCCLGPLFLGPMSELYGRTIVLQLANLFFLFFNLGCGLAKTKQQLIAFRFLAGYGGSAPRKSHIMPSRF